MDDKNCDKPFNLRLSKKNDKEYFLVLPNEDEQMRWHNCIKKQQGNILAAYSVRTTPNISLLGNTVLTNYHATGPAHCRRTRARDSIFKFSEARARGALEEILLRHDQPAHSHLQDEEVGGGHEGPRQGSVESRLVAGQLYHLRGAQRKRKRYLHIHHRYVTSLFPNLVIANVSHSRCVGCLARVPDR
jgi:hypothetical protein